MSAFASLTFFGMLAFGATICLAFASWGLLCALGLAPAVVQGLRGEHHAEV